MAEEYRIIKDFESYSVSNIGNIRNNKTGKILKLKNCHGYKTVNIYGKFPRVHRLVGIAFIPNIDNKPYIDHIDNDKTNNNVYNLRWVDCNQSVYNRQTPKSSSSGITGVSFYKNKNKWRAQIKHNYKYIHLGYFDKKEDAIKIRQLKANELFGEYVHKSEKIIN